MTEKQRAVAGVSLQSWQEIVKGQPANGFAQDQVQRLQTSLNGGKFLGELIQLSTKDTANMSATKMSESLARMNAIVDKTAEGLNDNSQRAFKDRTSKILTDYGTRIDLKRLKEQGITNLTGTDLERVVQFSGDRLIARARQIAAIEQREAAQARAVTDRALDKERKDQAASPQSFEQTALDRRVTEEALKNSATQAREAQTSASAAQTFETNLTKPIEGQAVQSSARLKELEQEREAAVEKIKSPAEKDGPQRSKPTRQK